MSLTKCWAEDIHSLADRGEYFSQESSATHVLGWCLSMIFFFCDLIMSSLILRVLDHICESYADFK